MKILKKGALFFIAGAIGYAVIELLWRGRTHPTMMIAGGLSFLSFSFIAKRFSDAPLLAKAILGSLTVTLIELVFGLIFNVWLKMEVWDYSSQPLNLFGQICPLFSILWCGLAIIFIPLAEKMNEMLT